MLKHPLIPKKSTVLDIPVNLDSFAVKVIKANQCVYIGGD